MMPLSTMKRYTSDTGRTYSQLAGLVRHTANGQTGLEKMLRIEEYQHERYGDDDRGRSENSPWRTKITLQAIETQDKRQVTARAIRIQHKVRQRELVPANNKR